MIGELLEHLLQIFDDQRVPLLPPPVVEYSIGQHDQVTVVMPAVDDDVAEVIFTDPRHC